MWPGIEHKQSAVFQFSVYIMSTCSEANAEPCSLADIIPHTSYFRTPVLFGRHWAQTDVNDVSGHAGSCYSTRRDIVSRAPRPGLHRLLREMILKLDNGVTQQ